MPTVATMARVQRVTLGLRNMGLLPSVVYKLQRARNIWSPRNQLLRLSTRYCPFPLHARAGSSDLDVFAQIFITREYVCLDDLRPDDVRLVIDCGANAGFSSAYFLSAFPKSQVIAVEPDPDNFAMLGRNVARFGSRARTIRSGVWSHPARLVLSEFPFGDGREWSRTVREARSEDEAAMTAVDIGSLLADSGHARISVLKIDVEGAETAIFGAGPPTWLHKVDNLLIELHGPECERLFHAAIAPQRFEISTSGELTVCRRRA